MERRGDKSKKVHIVLVTALPRRAASAPFSEMFIDGPYGTFAVCLSLGQGEDTGRVRVQVLSLYF